MYGNETGIAWETVLVSVAATALILVAGVIVVQCVSNIRFLRACRQDLLRRLGALPMHKMLQLLGVSRRRYLAGATKVEIEKHLSNCEHCTDVEACERALRQGDVSRANEFCPNFAELSGHRRRSGFRGRPS